MRPGLQSWSSTEIGTGGWTLSNGPGIATFSPDATDPNAEVTVSEFGSYTFTWTETNGTCSNSSDTEVNFFVRPVANAGSGGDECDLNFTFMAVPSIGTGTWTQTTGPGTASFFPDSNSPNAEVTVSAYGSYTFTWTEVNAVCTSSETITINFYEQPVANPGYGGNNCGLDYFLSAVPTGVGTGVWSNTAGPGSVSFDPDVYTPNAKVTASDFGFYTFVWTVVNGTCSDNASIIVNFVEAPAANAGEGGDECDMDFNLGALIGTGSGTWSMISGPGNALFNPAIHHPDAVVTVDQLGTYEFAWSEVNVTCQSVDIVTVVFHPLPDISAGNDTIICEDTPVQLQATGIGSFSWDPAGLLNDPEIDDPIASPLNTSTFTVTLTDQFGCVNSDTIEVVVWDQPVAYGGPDQVLDYIFEATMEAVLGEHETGTWSVTLGSGIIDNINEPNTRITGLSLNNNTILWTVTNGVCPADHDYVNIEVNDLIIPTLITPNLDGNNDFFILRGIETLGKTELVIFDRRGVQVYKNSNYNNEWDGVDFNGKPLPDDTYFFVMKTNNGKSVSGYIVIRR